MTFPEQVFLTNRCRFTKKIPANSCMRATFTSSVEQTKTVRSQFAVNFETMLLLLSFLILAVLGYYLIRIILSDADLTLSSCKLPSKNQFAGKVVWITGASQGIGESLALSFNELGARLILSARSTEKLEAVKNKCKSGEVKLLPFDLASGSEAIRIAVEKAENIFSQGVDIVVHNAGHPRPKMTCDESTDSFLRSIFEVNVFAPIELTRAILPKMLSRGFGHFVVVSSAAGKVPSPTQGVYSATKHAINGYFHTLNSEFSKKGIKVTVVCPGPISTPSVENSSKNKSQTQVKESSKDRMTSERCAELIVKATASGLNEAWISTQPVLLFLYIMQYFPSLGFKLSEKIGPKRVRALKEGGKDLYNTSLLFGGSSKSSNEKSPDVSDGQKPLLRE